LISNPQWSKENGLLLESYSPLGSDKQVGQSLSVPEVMFFITDARGRSKSRHQVKDIACKLGITPAQVLISWAVQRGVCFHVVGLIRYNLHFEISLDGRPAKECHTLPHNRELGR